jgi:hypothetical protein
MKLTFIYVKRLPNGLFYLGKTVRDPKTYIGSGTYWIRTIKKYNYKITNIETWILHETQDKKELKDLGLYYSDLFKVVKSKSWANLKPENGDGGQGPGFMKNDPNHPAKRQEVKNKISKTLLGEANWMRGKKGVYAPMYGYKHTEESIEKIKESALKSANRIKVNQYSKDGVFITSWNSMTEAEKCLGIYHIGEVCSGHRKYAGGFIWKN